MIDLLAKHEARLEQLKAERQQFMANAVAQRDQFLANLNAQAGAYDGRIAELEAVIEELKKSNQNGTGQG